MSIKSYLTLSIVAFTAIIQVGCSTEEDPVLDEQATESSYYPIEIQDVTGTSIVIEEQPEHIVSLIPSNTEIVYALGAGELLVGRSDFDDYPEEVLDVQSIGGMEFDVEQIIDLEPDVILAHESGIGQAETSLDHLKEAGYPVYVVQDAQTLDAVYESIQSIAEILNHTNQSELLIEDMQNKMQELSALTNKPEDQQKSVWVEISPQPIYVAGKDTFMHELLGGFHALNAAEDVSGWVEMSEESSESYNPDVMISTYGSTEEMATRPAWQHVQAIEDEALYDIDPNLVSRPGPRLVEGAWTLAEYIYPEDFSE